MSANLHPAFFLPEDPKQEGDVEKIGAPFPMQGRSFAVELRVHHVRIGGSAPGALAFDREVPDRNQPQDSSF
jgi:hypothetical protein